MTVDVFAEKFQTSLASLGGLGVSRLKVQDMLVQCRKLLESRDLKRAYPVLNMYANWVVHSQLIQSAAAADILQQINSFVVGLISGEGGGPFGRGVTRRFSLDVLRNEMLKFCNDASLDCTAISNNAVWAMIRLEVLELIGDSKIATSDKNILKMIGQNTDVVVSALITRDPSIVSKFKGLPTVANGFVFVLEAKKTSELEAGPYQIISRIVL